MIREPLSVRSPRAVRRTPSSRFSLVLRSAVVAVALAAVGNLLASGDQSSQLLALLTPTFVALAVAVGGSPAAARDRPAVDASYGDGREAPRPTSPSRRLSRRQDVANLMIPLLLAAAVLTFAAATACDLRRLAGGPRPGRGRRGPDLRHRPRPPAACSRSPARSTRTGKYLAAAATNTVGDDMSRSVFVDTSRLDRVVAWDPAWSDRSLASLQRRSRSTTAERITFTGTDLLVDVGDVSLRSRTGVRSSLRIQYVDGRGEQRT